MDVETVQRLVKAHNPKFIVPLGVGAFVKKLGVENVKELDWWENGEENGFQIHSVPANHFSGRGLFDRDRTLWSGFVIEHIGRNLYYVGDTGYSEIFKEVGNRFPQIDVALIPIGAYKPEWFMGPIHVTPEEAILIHQDIKSQKSLAMHFGCFPLADDSPRSATDRFKAAMVESKVAEDHFIISQEGYSYVL